MFVWAETATQVKPERLTRKLGSFCIPVRYPAAQTGTLLANAILDDQPY